MKSFTSGIFLYRSIASGVQKRTLLMSMLIERMMRLPPDSSIHRQFLNESPVSTNGGIVVIVLSKFSIFTVFSVTSSTVPSTLYFGMLIQSPGLSILFAESMMPDTNPRIESLKISIRMAADAPSPASRCSGDRPTIRPMMTMPPTKNRLTCRI